MFLKFYGWPASALQCMYLMYNTDWWRSKGEKGRVCSAYSKSIHYPSIPNKMMMMVVARIMLVVLVFSDQSERVRVNINLHAFHENRRYLW